MGKYRKQQQMKNSLTKKTDKVIGKSKLKNTNKDGKSIDKKGRKLTMLRTTNKQFNAGEKQTKGSKLHSCEIELTNLKPKKQIRNNEQRKKRKRESAEASEESDFEVADEDYKEKEVINDGNNDADNFDTRDMVKKQNKKNKKSGGFQSMGLSYNIYKGVIRKGYKVPTPIQRKAIPPLMDGKDVVAMARTGSGKTAAFLIPMFEKLQVHSTKGARALILSPTRELAVQTMKFTKDLGKYTDLKFSLILGGDSMENQFTALHENPDILIATPGRLLHLLVEMDIKHMATIEYLVFDEADRLFEMGFSDQLQEILRRLSESRQTILFSATLPKVLVDFATAGLSDPTLIRLDVDTKISEKLKMSFFLLRNDDKIACLLHILQTLINAEEQTVIFVATKHHVEYLQQLLTLAGINCSYIYSSLDQTARKISIAKFRKKLSMVLVVTDIAARGIDIPMLDNVINFNFPSKPKLFVHRVGRVARAGRFGTAYSLVMKDELPFMLDLHLFLGRPVKYANTSTLKDEDGIIGTVPQSVLVDEQDFIDNATTVNFNLVAMHKVMMNGYKQYVKSREVSSTESIKRAKEVDLTSISHHPVFSSTEDGQKNKDLSQLLLDLQKFKPNLTVFEAMNTKKSRESENVMRVKRKHHCGVIEQRQQKQQQQQKQKEYDTKEKQRESAAVIADDDYIANSFVFSKNGYKDENYIPRQSSDYHGEKGFNIKSFETEAHSISVDVAADDSAGIRKHHTAKKWDRKKKKYVSADDNKTKKIKTESGSYIPASYKSKYYSEWVQKNRFAANTNDEEENEKPKQFLRGRGKSSHVKRGTMRNVGGKKGARGTLKTKDQMIRNRLTASRGRGGRGGGRGDKRGGGRGRGK